MSFLSSLFCGKPEDPGSSAAVQSPGDSKRIRGNLSNSYIIAWKNCSKSRRIAGSFTICGRMNADIYSVQHVLFRRKSAWAGCGTGEGGIVVMRILENRGNWYKGNMHMHTTVSDGVLEPKDAVEVYRNAGYDFVSVTDHRKTSHLWQGEDFLILPGCEFDTGNALAVPVYHILGIGMNCAMDDIYHPDEAEQKIVEREQRFEKEYHYNSAGSMQQKIYMPGTGRVIIGADGKEYPYPYKGAPLGTARSGVYAGGGSGTPMRYHPHPQAVIDAIRDAGGLPILAHPAWSVMTPGEMLELHGFAAAEIYNSISGYPWNPGRAESNYYWDIWAKNGRLVPCVAGDDSHHYEGEHLRAFTMVNAQALTRNAIMDALDRGNFYASMGPRFYSIEYIPEEGLVSVECSRDVRTVVFLSDTPWPSHACQRIDGSGGAQYHLMPSDSYVRVELIDEEGRKAWCSPFRV